MTIQNLNIFETFSFLICNFYFCNLIFDIYFSYISMQQSGQTKKHNPHPLQLDASLTLADFMPFLFKSSDRIRFFEGQKKTQSWQPLHFSLSIEITIEAFIFEEESHSLKLV